MKDKVMLVCFVIVIMSLTVLIDFTNARFYSTVSMSGDLDYVKTVGKISNFHPNWSEEYVGPDNGSGVFQFTRIPAEDPGIHYTVTNKSDNIINEQETIYYIRVVAEDGSNNIPVEYDVHEYKDTNEESDKEPDKEPPIIYNFEEGVGYGPFILNADTETEKQYSLKVAWTQMNENYTTGVQHLKVQMVKKRLDNSLKVIDEAPLNLEYIGKKGSIDVDLEYYLYGSSPARSLGTASTFVPLGKEIDFTNTEQLNKLGITIPPGYSFKHIESQLTGENNPVSRITIPTDTTGIPRINVYCTSDDSVPITFSYFDVKDPDTLIAGTQQNLIIPKGSEINFKDITSLSTLGIVLPTGYAFNYATSYALDSTWAPHDSFTIPKDIQVMDKIVINVVLQKIETPKPVKALIYNANNNTLVGEAELTPDDNGNFTFTKASLNSLNSALAGKTSIVVGIANVTETGTNTYGVDNIQNVNSIVINYNQVFEGGYSLKYGMNIYIGFWW